ncbi:MAG TPA: tRNA pseudouridine(13) synthase TruD [Aquifex aeolicus]|nr:tRNA pseudouridine(13) synthase TruD [Aquifex aeolicus]
MTMLKTLTFDFPLKVTPFDFIVKEEGEYPEGENYYLYKLVKRNLNTNDPLIVNFLKELGVKDYGYAGLKDRLALTVQNVSLDKFIGEKLVYHKIGKYFGLLFVKRIAFKIKTGFLKGNRFFINHQNRLFNTLSFSLNYYDSQRLGKNVSRGRRFLKGKPSKKWERIFWINSYQSFVWNLTAFEVVRRKLEEYNRKGGLKILEPCRVEDKRVFHIFPCSRDKRALEEFLESLKGIKIPLVGYKVKIPPWLEEIINPILAKGGVDVEDFRRWRLKGDWRPLVVEVKGIRRYPKSLSFFLPKGAFATVYIKQLWLLEVYP